jgi:hypothetical protein
VDHLSLDSGRGATGGNIENQGDLLIRHSTLFSGWATVDGGGIHNTGTLTVIDSTFQGNGTDRHGGTIYNEGTVAFINSTIGRSRAHASGGGIHNATGIVTVINSTIAESRADANGLGSGDGGGIWTAGDPAAKTFLYNTLVVGNDAGFINFQHDSDIAGKNLEPGSSNNLISDPMSADGLTEGVEGNLLGDGNGNLLGIFSFVDYPPAPGGGDTPTYRPLPGSRAIDAGNNAVATTLGNDRIPGTGDTNETTLVTDQRGAPFLRSFGPAVDIGAVEYQTIPAALLVVTTTADHVDYADADVSLREAINSAVGSAGDNTITFGGPVFTDATPDTIALEHGQLWVFDPSSLTIRGTGSELLSIDAQDQSRVIYFEAFYGELHVEKSRSPGDDPRITAQEFNSVTGMS